MIPRGGWSDLPLYFCSFFGKVIGQTHVFITQARIIPILDSRILKTPPTHPISRRPSRDRLITVPQTQFKNPRIFVQGWTTGQFEHVTRQRWVVRRSMRITWRHKNLGQLHFSVLSVLMKSLGMNLSYELNKIDNSMIGI